VQPRVVGGPGEEDDRQVQRPAPAARPRCVGDRAVACLRIGRSKQAVARGRQQHPDERQVGRGVARGDVTKVKHAADPAVPDEDVGRVRVAVQPHGGTVPPRDRQRGLPGGKHRVAIDLPSDGRKVPREVVRALRKRHPPVGVGRSVRRRGHVQRPEEAAEVRRRPPRVERRPVRGGRPRQELHDAPRPRVALPRPSGPHRHRDGQRQPGREQREPTLLVDQDARAKGAPRQPGHQPVPQPEHRVVPSVSEWLDRQSRQVRVLRGKQPTHQVRGDLTLCRRHLVHHRLTLSDGNSRKDSPAELARDRV
jgi:hypothetical protein